MALGGGTFVSQNKLLPGGYVNVVSTATAQANLSDRGIVAVAVGLPYSPKGVFEVTSEILNKKSLELFCTDAGDDALRPIREILLNAKTVLVYNLYDSSTKASNTFATAKYAGTNGNNIKISIAEDVDNSSNYLVSTLIGNVVVDEQSVAKDATTSGLMANAYVDWIADVALTETAATSMTNGASKNSGGTVSNQNALNAFEAYTFNAITMPNSSETIAKMVISYTKRFRDEVGKKFKCVVYDCEGDYEGVINVVTPTDTSSKNDLIYWVAGAEAGCALNRSLTNRIYNGEYTPVVTATQAALEAYIENGKFAFHKVGDDVRVLMDINGLVTTTETKGESFKSNQTVRITDQIANDIATIFNTKFIGGTQNTTTGRALFKADIVEHHKQLNAMNAIEGFTADAVTVEQGDKKGAVVVYDKVTPVGAMEQLYMTVYVS